MMRRIFLAASGASSLGAEQAAGPIQLHIELEVDPAKEAELVAAFRSDFRPAIRKQPGFLDVKLLKMRKLMADRLDGNWTYKLVLSFRTEEQRQAWAKSADHEKAWPKIAATLTGRKIRVILYDVVT